MPHAGARTTTAATVAGGRSARASADSLALDRRRPPANVGPSWTSGDPVAAGSGLTLLSLALIALALAGCAGKDEEPYVERPVDELYNQALDLLKAGDPKKAAQAFEEVERQHPYSEWATRAQLMAAYAYYQANSTTTRSMRRVASSTCIPATTTSPTPTI